MIDKKFEEIWSLHNSIHAKIRQASMRYYQEMGVSWQEVIMLHTVRMNPNITLGALSQKMGISKSTASSMVSRMTEAGVLVREIPDENRRTVHLRIAELHEKKQELIEKRSAFITEQLSNMTEEDIEIVLKGLERMDSLIKG